MQLRTDFGSAICGTRRPNWYVASFFDCAAERYGLGMKSVAIVTQVGNKNFGNRLQNFALQETIGKLGFHQVDTLVCRRSGQSVASRVAWRARSGPQNLRQWAAGRIDRFLGRKSTSSLGGAREDALLRFSESYISTRQAATVDEVASFAGDYSYFVAGSDQIWNPQSGLREPAAFLSFAQPQQRIAYAASFGMPGIPALLKGTYRSGISGMRAVSVREEQAASIVEDLTGWRVPVVLDPTMLVPRSVWCEMAIRPRNLEGYVAEFFLGDSPDSSEMLPVEQFASRSSLERIDLKRDLRPELVDMGPLEFIGAVGQADLLVTDSFHAAVFASIFEVPCLIRGRGDMNSRFDTLLRTTGLARPRWRTLRELEESVDIDWNVVRGKLDRERTHSLNFLRGALCASSGSF